jgi:hypothetical protein
MNLIIEPKRIEWWFWTITLAFIITALLGWPPGYYIVVLISALQIFFFWIRFRSLFGFDTQVRIVYFAFSILGLMKLPTASGGVSSGITP